MVVAPAEVITTPAFLHFATISFAQPSKESKANKVTALWLSPLADTKTAQLSFQNLFYSFKLRTDDIGMFSHMLYHSVNILEETYMTQLVYFVMADGLVL